MRIIFVLTCCLALAYFAGAAEQQQQQQQQQQDNPHPRKKGQGVQSSQQVITPRARTSGHAIEKGKFQTQQRFTPMPRNISRAPFRTTAQATGVSAKASLAASGRAQRFDLPKKSNQAVGVKFQGTGHIEGSENWKGKDFEAFRNFHHEWHDGDWWRLHHDRIVVIIINNTPSFFFFDAGFWFPAWGYNPYSIYPYDGPIYGYNNLPPDQVVANVQAALQAQGYYQGEIDGVLGPLTRAALANYQRDHGLYVTAAVDRPTMASLGMG